MSNHKELIEKMKAQRKGKLLPAFEYLAEVDPDFLEAYNNMAVLNFSYPPATGRRALDAKTQELLAIALLASVHGETTPNHIRRALELGATEREVVEALEMTLPITGAAGMEFGLSHLMAIRAGHPISDEGSRGH